MFKQLVFAAHLRNQASVTQISYQVCIYHHHTPEKNSYPNPAELAQYNKVPELQGSGGKLALYLPFSYDLL